MTVRVTINDSGAITIPEELRKACGLRADDEVILETVDRGILLRPTSNVSIELYSDERIAEFAAEEKMLAAQINPTVSI